MARTADTLFNITEVEYETIEGKLNEVTAKQQILMEETVLTCAENVEVYMKSKQRNQQFRVQTSLRRNELDYFKNKTIAGSPQISTK